MQVVLPKVTSNSLLTLLPGAQLKAILEDLFLETGVEIRSSELLNLDTLLLIHTHLKTGSRPKSDTEEPSRETHLPEGSPPCLPRQGSTSHSSPLDH